MFLLAWALAVGGVAAAAVAVGVRYSADAGLNFAMSVGTHSLMNTLAQCALDQLRSPPLGRMYILLSHHMIVSFVLFFCTTAVALASVVAWALSFLLNCMAKVLKGNAAELAISWSQGLSGWVSSTWSSP